jgi:hypothetical protein
MKPSQHYVFLLKTIQTNGAFCFRSPQGKLYLFVPAKKSLRLKVYSLGTGKREGTHINPNKE